MVKLFVWSYRLLELLCTGWPNKNRTFLRDHIPAAIADIIMRFFAEVFRNYSRKQHATIF